jgi:hypothetical protein
MIAWCFDVGQWGSSTGSSPRHCVAAERLVRGSSSHASWERMSGMARGRGRVEIRAMQRTAVDTCLKLARLPFDMAISMFPDGDGDVRPAAKAAVDRADAGIRTIVAMVLCDHVSGGDTTRQGRHNAGEERDDGDGHESDTRRARYSKELQQEDARNQRGHTRDVKAPPAERAAAGGQHASPAERSASRERRAEPGARSRHAAITGAAGRTAARTGRSGTPGPAPGIVSTERQPPPASADEVSSEPSHDAIAARAYELYQRGMPGGAHSHWEAAKRELTSVSR